MLIPLLTAVALATPALAMQEPVTARRERIPLVAPERAPADDVLAALRSTREALARWRATLEAGAAAPSAEQLSAIQSETIAMFEHLEAIRNRVQAAQPARPAARPEAGSSSERAVGSEAQRIARVWIDDAHALGTGGAERRAAAIETIRAALSSGVPAREWAALQALQQIGDVEYDKASFRELVLPYAQTARGSILVNALYALHNTSPADGDLALVHAAWERSPEAIAGSISHLLVLFGDRQIHGRSAEIVLEVLGSEDGRRIREGLHGLWGARVDDAVAARLIQLSHSADGDLRHQAIYFGLSTLYDKSEPVIDALIATLNDPDWNNSGRALWGLGFGVPEQHGRKVGAALVDLHNARSDPQVRERCERIVRQLGDAELIGKLAR